MTNRDNNKGIDPLSVEAGGRKGHPTPTTGDALILPPGKFEPKEPPVPDGLKLIQGKNIYVS